MAQAGKKKKIFDGRYEIDSIVGRGACSVVYRARHVNAPTTDVALKVLLRGKDQRSSTDLLRKEALAMVSSRHKYVVRLDDFHSVKDLCYLAMEYAPESDLRVYTAKLGGKLPLVQAERFLFQIAEALSFIHQVGILHRDIKPDNMLVINDRQIRIADFGVAVLPGEESSIEELEKGIGTMDYMAPEVFEGTACDRRSDIYCLGLTFYEVLSGIQPFVNIPLARVLEVRNNHNVPQLATLVPDVPKELAAIIMRCIDYNPEQRFQHAGELYNALVQYRASHARAEAGQEGRPLPPEQPRQPANEDRPGDQNEVRAKRKRRRRKRKPTGTSLSGQAPPQAQPQQVQAKTAEPARKPMQRFERPVPRQKVVQPVADQEPIPQQPFVQPPPQSPPQGQSRLMQEPPAAVTSELPSELLQPVVDEEQAQTWNEPEALEPEVVEPEVLMEEGVQEPIAEPAPQDTSNEQANVFDFLEDVSGDDDAVDEYGRTHSNSYVEVEPEPADEPSPVYDHERNQRIAAEMRKEYEPKTFAQARPQGRHMLSKSKSSSKKPLIVGILIIVALFAAGDFFMKKTSGAGIMRLMQTSGGESPIPAFAGGALTFPQLPAGMYSGSLSGLVPGKVIPFAMIAMPERNELTLILGVEGWVPVTVPLAAEEGATGVLEVRAGGMALLFKAAGEDGILQGTFQNLITDEEGQWKAEPVN